MTRLEDWEYRIRSTLRLRQSETKREFGESRNSPTGNNQRWRNKDGYVTSTVCTSYTADLLTCVYHRNTVALNIRCTPTVTIAARRVHRKTPVTCLVKRAVNLGASSAVGQDSSSHRGACYDCRLFTISFPPTINHLSISRTNQPSPTVRNLYSNVYSVTRHTRGTCVGIRITIIFPALRQQTPARNQTQLYTLILLPLWPISVWFSS